MPPGGEEAEGTDGKEKVLPMESPVEDPGEDDWHDQKDDDRVENKPGQQQASFPKTEAAKGEDISGQGQRGEDADEDAWNKGHNMQWNMIL